MIRAPLTEAADRVNGLIGAGHVRDEVACALAPAVPTVREAG